VARRRLIRRAKKAKDPHTALRFIMIAKLGQGLSRQQVARDLACVRRYVVSATQLWLGADGLNCPSRRFGATGRSFSAVVVVR
jgi:hypothetical protein